MNGITQWLGRFKISQKIWAGFGLLLLTITIISMSALNGFRSTSTDVKSVVGQDVPTMAASMKLQNALVSSAQALGFYMHSREERDKKIYLYSIDEIDQALAELKALPGVSDNTTLQQSMPGIITKIDRYKAYRGQMVELASDESKRTPATALAAQELNPRAMSILQMTQEMIASELEEDASEVSRQKINVLGNLRHHFDTMVSEFRAFLFSRSDAQLSNIKLFLGEVDNDLNTLSSEYSETLTFEQEEGLIQVTKTVGEYKSYLDKVIEIQGSDKWRVDQYLIRTELRPLLDSVKQDLNSMVQAQQDITRQTGAELESLVSSTQGFVLTLSIIGIFAGILIAWLTTTMIICPLKTAVQAMSEISEGDGDLTRRLDVNGKDEIAQLAVAFNTFAGKIHTLVVEVSSSTTQLAAASEELSLITHDTTTGVVSQQNDIDQVATAINELSATVQEVNNNAQSAAGAADQASTHTRDGSQVVKTSIAGIGNLAQEIEQASQVIHKLEQDTDAIGEVLAVIRGIADQTNLLALNAAIEAARAGEQGRGFAVVADEVRTLASRTQESTQEIQQTIEQLQAGARNAVQAMNTSREMAESSVDQASQTGKALDDITTAVSTINDMNTQIASASNEQSLVTEEINQNVVNITQVAEQTASSAEQIDASSRELAHLSSQLQTLVGQFKV